MPTAGGVFHVHRFDSSLHSVVTLFFFVAAYGRRLRRKDEERREQALLKTCPRCAEQIKAAALVCRYCGHEFAEPVVTGVSGSDKK
jgi:ribosomal protein L37AE/L43A